VDDWARIREACTLLEDEAALVLSKPVGISVVGERHDADLLSLARDAGERLLPVHRIDKVTSGAVLLAKLPSAHAELTRQFNRRSAGKVYLAVTGSRGLPERGTIDLPLSVGRKNRVRVAAKREAIQSEEAGGRWSVPPAEVFTHTRTYPSLTTFVRVWEGRRRTLLAVQPVTGRRHQIRVHLAWIGHPVEGDPLFARPSAAGTFRAAGSSGGAVAAPVPTRTALHSWRLAFDAPWAGNARIEVEASPGDDFWACLPTHPDVAPATLLDRARAAVRA
jgi:tRNA pseudouridine32 synthase/23S rRNA pseudouridine746 synthase/23S rRNA pseudouridine1911/1915/1917 synthase